MIFDPTQQFYSIDLPPYTAVDLNDDYGCWTYMKDGLVECKAGCSTGPLLDVTDIQYSNNLKWMWEGISYTFDEWRKKANVSDAIIVELKLTLDTSYDWRADRRVTRTVIKPQSTRMLIGTWAIETPAELRKHYGMIDIDEGNKQQG